MKKYLLYLLLSLTAMAGGAQPPNNLIFFGGSGDGSQNAGFSIAGNLLFFGGAGDGISATSNNAMSNNIFSGSAGDGFANESNNAIANNIFLGSTGDGFANESNNAISNNIFLGSTGDGFSFSSNDAISNNIFLGGVGDGWSAVIYPLGPLPVKLLSFTAEYAGAGHLVKWVTAEEINTKHFEVQRSANGSNFVTLGNITPLGGPSTGASYSFNVPNPWTGNNFYRLKIVDTDGSFVYSSIVLLKNTGQLQLSVYPNPTAALLYVRIPVINNISTINAMVYDANGRVVIQTGLKPGSSTGIDVSKLTAGIYSLKCTIDDQPFVLRFIKAGF